MIVIKNFKKNITVWHLSIPIIWCFSPSTFDRWIHFLWAIFFVVFLVFIFTLFRQRFRDSTCFSKKLNDFFQIKGVRRFHAFLMSLVVLYLGSWIPDLDWKFNMHRSIFTHSCLPLVIVWFILKKTSRTFGNWDWNWKLFFVFGYGLASHLIIDFPQGNVVWFTGRGKAFLFANGLLVFSLTVWLQRRHYVLAISRQ